MFIKLSLLKRKIRGASLEIFNRIENNGNAAFRSNGEERFILNLFQSFSKNKQKRVVFDIGANIGNYSKIIEEEALKTGVDVDLHLFEPTKKSFEVLKCRFDAERTTLNQFGASSENGLASIFYDKELSSLSSLYQRNLDCYKLKLDQSEEVKLKRLDGYIREKNIKHIDFMKVDIEGHELKAFEGFGEYLDGGFIDYIQFEYGGANLDSGVSLMEIYQMLSGRNFVIAKVMPTGLEVRSYSPYMDNFNYANYVAVSRNKIQ